MKKLIFLCLLFCASLAFGQADGPGGASSAGIPNKCGHPNCTVSGTLTVGKCIGPGITFDNSATANQTLKNSAGTYVLSTTTDTATPLAIATNVVDSTHVCVAGSGSQATVQVDSGGATALHYALQSTTTNGKVKDSGATTVPASGCWLGVFAANASASTNGTVIVNPGCAQVGVANNTMLFIGPVNAATEAFPAANAVKVYGFYIAQPGLTIGNISYKTGSTADNNSGAGHNYGIGIYGPCGSAQANCPLVAHIVGAGTSLFNTANSTKNFAFAEGSVPLVAGRYYIAITTDCSVSCATLVNTGSYATFAQAASATGTSTTGILPSTITTPSDSWFTGSLIMASFF